MTMLDRMRRHRDWLKWSLGLVCVAFVLFYIPDFLRGSGADAASGDTVAKVEGREISGADFRRTYQAQLQAYRSAYGGNMSDQLLKQLGATAASSYHFLMPPLGMLFGWLMLGEHVSAIDLAGIVPVALGIYLVTRPASA